MLKYYIPVLFSIIGIIIIEICFFIKKRKNSVFFLSLRQITKSIKTLMEDNIEIFQSLENPKLRLIRYKSYFSSLYEISIEINDNERPKYPLIFRISKRCEENELDELTIHLMSIVDAEFPANTWQLL